MKIKRFNESSESKIFENTQPYELALMEDQEIIDLISNTFKSKVISSDPKWIVIESDWKHIDNDGNGGGITKLQNAELIGKTYKVYFHIYKDDFLILRGNPEQLEALFNQAKSKFPSIKKSGGTEGSSLIIKGRMFPNILYALAPIPKDKDTIHVNGDYYSLKSFSCDTDIRLDKESIAYFSNLLIGSTIEQENRLKKDYPGMSKVDALKNSIEDKIKENPDLFKHLNK